MNLTPLRELQLATLLLEAAGVGGVSVDEMLSKSHSATLVHARRVFVQFARDQGFSYPQIGYALHRHHTTVIHLAKTAGYTERKLSERPPQ